MYETLAYAACSMQARRASPSVLTLQSHNGGGRVRVRSAVHGDSLCDPWSRSSQTSVSRRSTSPTANKANSCHRYNQRLHNYIASVHQTVQ